MARPARIIPQMFTSRFPHIFTAIFAVMLVFAFTETKPIPGPTGTIKGGNIRHCRLWRH